MQAVVFYMSAVSLAAKGLALTTRSGVGLPPDQTERLDKRLPVGNFPFSSTNEGARSGTTSDSWANQFMGDVLGSCPDLYGVANVISTDYDHTFSYTIDELQAVRVRFVANQGVRLSHIYSIFAWAIQGVTQAQIQAGDMNAPLNYWLRSDRYALVAWSNVPTQDEHERPVDPDLSLSITTYDPSARAPAPASVNQRLRRLLTNWFGCFGFQAMSGGGINRTLKSPNAVMTDVSAVLIGVNDTAPTAQSLPA